MSAEPDFGRVGRPSVERTPGPATAPPGGGLRAAHAHDLAACPGEAAAAAASPLQGAAG